LSLNPLNGLAYVDQYWKGFNLNRYNGTNSLHGYGLPSILDA